MEATDAGQEGSRAGERRMSNEDVADTKEDRMSDVAMISKTGGRRGNEYPGRPDWAEELIETNRKRLLLENAAPDLKEALENLVIHLGMGWEIDELIVAAEAALMKAEGQS